MTKIGEDVTTEYLQSAKPGNGRIMLDAGLDERQHADEIKVAQWLHETFGGDITVQTESAHENVKSADFLWRGRLWELKIATEKSVDTRIRKAIKQIMGNPGGIIVVCKDGKTREHVMEKSIAGRLEHRKNKAQIDVIIVKNNRLVKVVRYKE